MLDFEWKENISINDKENESIITIDVSDFKINNDVNAYIRFRIHGKELKNLITNKKIYDNFFKTYSENNEIIDFRLNEKRSMPEGLVNLISGQKEFQVKAIHFLLLMDMKYTLAATGLNYSARALEPNLWTEYIGCDIKDAQFIGYHWKKKLEYRLDEKNKPIYVDNFNSLIRIEEKKCNFFTIAIYIIGLIFFSVLSNYIYDLIKLFFGLDF